MRTLHPHPRRQYRPAVVALGAALAAAVALSAACSDAPESPTAHVNHARGNGDLTAAQHQAIARVRNATARFHDLADARAAGYTEQFPAGCAASAEGAQGIHYLNPGLVDATVELLRPELVMYEPGPGGSMQLVGVDYVVPLSASDEPPTLLGVPFMRLEPLGVWALHIWAWRPNPSGMFAMWNPKVSCAHAR
jgi:hypothetical protein